MWDLVVVVVLFMCFCYFLIFFLTFLFVCALRTPARLFADSQIPTLFSGGQGVVCFCGVVWGTWIQTTYVLVGM